LYLNIINNIEQINTVIYTNNGAFASYLRNLSCRGAGKERKKSIWSKKQQNNYRNADGNNKKLKNQSGISSGILHVHIVLNKLKLHTSLFPSFLTVSIAKKIQQ